MQIICVRGDLACHVRVGRWDADVHLGSPYYYSFVPNPLCGPILPSPVQFRASRAGLARSMDTGYSYLRGKIETVAARVLIASAEKEIYERASMLTL